MTERAKAPAGPPCWADLWTSDTDRERAFYAGLLGWESTEADEQFGGYFMFTREGEPIAAAMGAVGLAMRANDTWKMFLSVEDIEATVAAGATIAFPPMAVADLGTQSVLTDPGGTILGAWLPGTFPGFSTINEHGAPSWFELHSAGYVDTLEFYRSVFGREITTVSDSDEF
jgi:uncharacterized protein